MSTSPDIDTLLPTFIIIGAAKCGTTTLAAAVDRHPQVFVTDPKEPHVFDVRTPRAGQIEWYRSLFLPGAHLPARGEASTGYTKHADAEAAERIHSAVPDAKLIYLIREPFERMESYYLMMLRQGQTEGDFEEVVRRNPEYVQTSSYGAQLSRYLELFARDQLLVLRLEDLSTSPTPVVRSVLEFIGVDPAVGPDDYDVRLNARPEGSQRRPLRTPRVIRPLLRYAPRRVKKSLKGQLQREIPRDEVVLDPAYRAELRSVFTHDFVTLREIVGPELDLYGLG